jgi:hypothetical protein
MSNPKGEWAGSFKQQLVKTGKKGGNQDGKLQTNFMQSRVKSIEGDAQSHCVRIDKVRSSVCAFTVPEKLRQEEVNSN